MTIRMPIGLIDVRRGRYYFEWVGTMYRVARSYGEYLECRKSRQRFLMLQKQEIEGRVRKEQCDTGFIYNDLKLKHRFFIENILVGENNRVPLVDSITAIHNEIDNLEGPNDDESELSRT